MRNRALLVLATLVCVAAVFEFARLPHYWGNYLVAVVVACLTALKLTRPGLASWIWVPFLVAVGAAGWYFLSPSAVWVSMVGLGIGVGNVYRLLRRAR